jgi:hypothetical protein
MAAYPDPPPVAGGQEKQAQLVAEVTARIADIQNTSRNETQSNPKASIAEQVQKVRWKSILYKT